MKKNLMLLAAGVLLAVGAQAQTAKIAIEGQAYVINDTAAANVAGGTLRYEWYRNNVLIPECTTATCTVPANLCNGYNVQFRRKVAPIDCVGNIAGWSNTVTITFKCGGGHGTKIDNLCWADRNVGAAGAFTATAHQYSAFYQWNRNQSWASGGNVVPPGSVWDNTADTLASIWTVTPHPCPIGWRLPTPIEFTALHNAGGELNGNTGGVWADANARGNTVAGRFFGSNCAACTFLPSGNMSGCIFLPACGVRPNINVFPVNQGSMGYYWSSTQYSDTDGNTLGFVNNACSLSHSGKVGGVSIRCVQDVQ